METGEKRERKASLKTQKPKGTLCEKKEREAFAVKVSLIYEEWKTKSSLASREFLGALIGGQPIRATCLT